MVGYYRVNGFSNSLNVKGPILHADKIKFVAIKDSIPLNKFYHSEEGRNCYRVALYSSNNKFREWVNGWLKELMDESKEDRTKNIINETKKLKRIRETMNENRYCKNCEYWKAKSKECPLIWRKLNWGNPSKETNEC